MTPEHPDPQNTGTERRWRDPDHGGPGEDAIVEAECAWCGLSFSLRLPSWPFRSCRHSHRFVNQTPQRGYSLPRPSGYPLWAFVTPGLTTKEKKYAMPFLLTSVVLFAAGGLLAYLAMPQGLRLLLTIGGEGLVAFLDAEKYLSFVGLMVLGFGVMFEMPVFLFFLGLVGVLSATQLRKQRRVAIVAIVALAAIVTPSQDSYTLLALSIPLYLLYELTIVALRLVDRTRAKRELKTV